MPERYKTGTTLEYRANDERSRWMVVRDAKLRNANTGVNQTSGYYLVPVYDDGTLGTMKHVDQRTVDAFYEAVH